LTKKRVYFKFRQTEQVFENGSTMKRGQPELSSRQQAVLDYIRAFLEERGYPPSVREIVTGCGISSTSVAAFHLKRLEAKGCLRRHPDISRGLELATGPDSEDSTVPLIGYIAAGKPIPVPAAETWDMTGPAEVVKVPRSLIAGKEAVYALKVKGDSMQDALISDGDTVLMQAVSRVENGETAAVWLRDEKEITLKKVFSEKGAVRLQPANARYQPIITRPENVEIQGRVVAVLRNL